MKRMKKRIQNMGEKQKRMIGALENRIERHTVLRLPYKTLKYIREQGFRAAGERVLGYLEKKNRKKRIELNLCSRKQLDQQRKQVFSRDVKFSILVPLYNTPPVFLKEMIQSVLDQTYGNWELCMADGSDNQHADVEQICKAYAQKDLRIRYQKLEKNLGIAANTNACMDMAAGDYIVLLDHDDILHPAALYENMCVICEKDADFIYSDENTFCKTPKDAYQPHVKPDFSPDTLRSYNYICHLMVFKASLLKEIGGGFRAGFDGNQDYDLVLRLTERAKCIVHIPKILYFWRSHPDAMGSDISAQKALKEHLDRMGLEGEVLDSRLPSVYKIQYKIEKRERISILIPNKDHVCDLKKCIDSVREKSTYDNWEIIVIENNSTETETFEYYQEIQKDLRIRVVYWKGEFNYSAINNYGAGFAQGEYILLLNNDTEVITPDWMEQMLMFAQRNDVGAVGSMLYYPDDTVQHGGIIFGLGGVAGHAHKDYPRDHYGYMSRMVLAQNMTAVTAACMLMRKNVWDEMHGLDENYKVVFNDVDLCLRIRKAGYLIVWTPFAELYHDESKSRGIEDTEEKMEWFRGEVQKFQQQWKDELEAGDPYYSPSFSLFDGAYEIG